LPLVVNFAPQYEAIGATTGAPFCVVNNERVSAAAARPQQGLAMYDFFVEADRAKRLSARGADLMVKIAGFVGLACEKTVSDTHLRA
jgi:hypothetical protein